MELDPWPPALARSRYHVEPRSESLVQSSWKRWGGGTSPRLDRYPPALQANPTRHRCRCQPELGRFFLLHHQEGHRHPCQPGEDWWRFRRHPRVRPRPYPLGLEWCLFETPVGRSARRGRNPLRHRRRRHPKAKTGAPSRVVDHLHRSPDCKWDLARRQSGPLRAKCWRRCQLG